MNSMQWSSEEDKILLDYIKNHSVQRWDVVGVDSGLNRTGKSCRLRWMNHLKPDVKKGPFSDHERSLFLRMHFQFGSKWSKMTRQLPRRSDNDIKNFWHTHGKRSSAGQEVVQRRDDSLSLVSSDRISHPGLWDATEARILEFPSALCDEPMSLGGFHGSFSDDNMTLETRQPSFNPSR